MIRRGFIVAAVLLWAVRLRAHKLQYSLTDLVWRADRRMLEIVHAVHLDDAMVLLARLGAPGGELDVATEARVMLYVEQRFGLGADDGQFTPEAVGAQIDGDYLWIYQELPMPDYPHSLQVRCSILQDLFEEQQNQVNLRVGDHVRTLRFDRDRQVDRFSDAIPD